MKTIQKVTFVIFFITLVYCASAAPNKESLEENEKSQNGEKSNLITGLVGGKKVSISKYPYMASVITRTSLEGSAVILNKKWVLTTGWVVLYEEADQVLIRAGSDSAIDKGQTSYAEKIVIHPQYSHSWKNDIALIKLKNPLQFNKNIKAIKLTTKTPEKGAKADISGFGYATANRQYSTDTREETGKLSYLHDGWLRATTLKVITYKDCQSYYQGVPYFTDVSFCAQASSTVGPCTFDWGSPLVVKNQVIGIFSGVNVCADEQYPPVFTDVIKFKDWINKTIKKNSSPKELEDLHMDIEYIN